MPFFVLGCISTLNKASNPIICGKNIRARLVMTSSSFCSKSNEHDLFLRDTKVFFFFFFFFFEDTCRVMIF